MSFIAKLFARMYVKKAYRPEKLPKLPQAGGSAFLKGVPWISYKVPYCFAAALEMASHYHGEKWVTLDFVNFAMGWTYTWTYLKGTPMGALPLSDPLEAVHFAAPYLGLRVKYYFTNDKDEFLNAARYYLLEGVPVLIALDPRILYGKEGETLGPTSHAELAVGFDESGAFYLYETGGADRRLKEGGEGVLVESSTLLEAVESATRTSMLPWRYHLHVLERREQGPERAYTRVYERLAQFLAGRAYGGWVYTGAEALRKVASEEKVLTSRSFPYWLRHAVDSRMRNANFLREFLESEEVAELFEEASKLYAAAAEAVEGGNLGEASRILREAADLEERAGGFFEKLAKNRELF